MFLPLIAVATIACSTLQRGQSLYQQVMTVADPTNGYGDYLRAADTLRDGMLDTYLLWNPDQLRQYTERRALRRSDDEPYDSKFADQQLVLATQLHNLDYLRVQRLCAERYAKAIDYVRAGNEKRVWDPRGKFDAATLFPELAHFKAVTKVLRVDAYVRFADGDSRGATADLLDGLTFARRIKGSSIINELVGIACEAILLRTFDEHLGSMSEADADAIARYCDAALSEPATYGQALTRERDMQMGAAQDLLAGQSVASITGEDHSPADEYMKKMTPSERKIALQRFSRVVDAYYSGLLEAIGKGESHWLDKTEGLPPEPQTFSTPEDFADMLVNVFMPVFTQATTAALRTRAQLRLLGLHARVIGYRWRHDRLPAELKDAVPGSLLLDPMSGEAFQYEVNGSSYRLYGKGTSATGMVELRYRPPKTIQKDDDPIPPIPRALLDGAFLRGSA